MEIFSRYAVRKRMPKIVVSKIQTRQCRKQENKMYRTRTTVCQPLLNK